MSFTSVARVVAASAAVLLLVGFVSVAAVRSELPRQRLAETAQRVVVARPQATQPIDQSQASEARAALTKIFEQYSPSVPKTLALSPSLLRNQAFLEPYPALAVFLKDHPEVVTNPEYYLARYRENTYEPYRPDPHERTLQMWSRLLQGLTIFGVFIVITSALVWLIRTIIDYRRWYRLSAVQTEVHNKLLDRFSSNDDLMNYMNTPAGRRFLESAPIALDPTSHFPGAPLRRILWAIEVGLVLGAGGAGLLITTTRVPVELVQPISVIGIVTISLGVGFILSAVASYLLSRRLGLLAGSGQDQAARA